MMRRLVAVVGLLAVLAGVTGQASAEQEPTVAPEAAPEATGGYPHSAMPCIHSPYATSGTGYWCAGYDWGPVRDGSQSTTWSSRGYGYRNCTDWVAWRLQSLGVADSLTRNLGNGGQWAANASGRSGLTVRTTPKVGAAAVVVGNPGHVAFVEAVNANGTISVSEYNAGQDGNYRIWSGAPSTRGFTRYVDFGASVTPPTEAIPISGSAITADDDGNVWAANVTEDGRLFTRKAVIGSGWGALTEHGSGGWSPLSRPSLTVDSGGRVWLVAVKANGNLYTRKGVPGSGWEDLTLQGDAGSWSPSSSPEVAGRPDGQITFVAVKRDGSMYSRNGQHGVGWSSFVPHGSGGWATTGGPSITSDTGGRIWLIATKANGNLYTRKGTPGSGWDDLTLQGAAGSWAPTSSPEIAGRTDGQVIVVAVKRDGSMYSRNGESGVGWGSFVPQGTGGWSIVGGPAVGMDTGGRIWLVAVKANGSVYTRKAIPGSGWEDFTQQGGPGSMATAVEPGVTGRSDGQVTFSVTTAAHQWFTRSGRHNVGWSDLVEHGAGVSWSDLA